MIIYIPCKYNFKKYFQCLQKCAFIKLKNKSFRLCTVVLNGPDFNTFSNYIVLF